MPLNINSLWKTLALALSLVLAGCQVINPVPAKDTASVEQAQQELEQILAQQQAAKEAAAQQTTSPPEAVTDALLPPMDLDNTISEDRFDIAVEGMQAKDFFIGLVKDTPYNMVVHPGISGEISLELKNVTVEEVMNIAREVFGYDYERTANLYRVLPSGMQTRLFKINYLNIRRMGSSETQVSAGQVSDVDTANSGNSNDLDNDDQTDSGSVRSVIGTRIKTSTDADFWAGLADTITAITGVGDGRRVVVSPQAGIVVVHAKAAELRSVQEFLDKAELSLGRQVVIEAKILEVQLNDGFQSGIDWSVLTEVGSGKSVVYSQTATGLSSVVGNGVDIGGVFSASLDLNDFQGLISLLGTQGTVQVLSSPRISTVNNQKAVIKVGTDEFFVTEVSSQNNNSVVGTTTTATIDVELTPFFSGIALDVTPQISDEGEIILHIHPTVSQVEDQTKNISAPVVGDLSLPLAISTIRESDTIVRARDGQVVVIGGLMQNTSNDLNSKSPVLGDLPVLGHAFRQKRQTSTKSELVILLRPQIADDQVWQQEIQRSKNQIDALKKGISTNSLYQ